MLGSRKAALAILCLLALTGVMIVGVDVETFSTFTDATIAIFTIFAGGNGVEHLAKAIKARAPE